MSGEEEAAELTIAEDLVVTKYKMGGDIANRECGPRPGGGRRGGGAGPGRGRPVRRGGVGGSGGRRRAWGGWRGLDPPARPPADNGRLHTPV